MDMKKLESRIQELSQAIEQSVANHHNLVGRLSEAQGLLKSFQDAAEIIEDVIEEFKGATNCS